MLKTKMWIDAGGVTWRAGAISIALSWSSVGWLALTLFVLALSLATVIEFAMDLPAITALAAYWIIARAAR